LLLRNLSWFGQRFTWCW